MSNEIDLENRIYAGTVTPDEKASLLKLPKLAALYAIYIQKGRWPEAEPIIATDAGASFVYAGDVVRGRWPLGEAAIASDGVASMQYARYVLQAPWAAGEPALLDLQ